MRKLGLLPMPVGVSPMRDLVKLESMKLYKQISERARALRSLTA